MLQSKYYIIKILRGYRIKDRWVPNNNNNNNKIKERKKERKGRLVG